MPTVEVNGVELYYERQGEGPPVVFLHGATSDLQMWGHQVEALAGEYQVITFDARGHGRSEGSDHDVYTIEMYADDLHGLIRELELESPGVVGLSLGGITGLKYAAQYDELSALAVSGALTPTQQSTTEWAVRRVVAPAISWIGARMGYDRMLAINRWFAEQFGEDVDEVEAAGEELRDDEVETDTDLGSVMSGTNRYSASGRLELEDITVPTLVMHGASEPFIEDHIPQFRRIPNVQVTEIPDAGHNTHVENPEAFTDAVRRFLEAA